MIRDLFYNPIPLGSIHSSLSGRPSVSIVYPVLLQSRRLVAQHMAPNRVAMRDIILAHQAERVFRRHYMNWELYSISNSRFRDRAGIVFLTCFFSFVPGRFEGRFVRALMGNERDFGP